VASNDSPTAMGEATTLRATVETGSAVSYVWDFGDGSGLDESGPVVSHVYGGVGVYTAVVMASNDVSSESAATEVVIEAVPPVAGFSSSSPDVLGATTSFANTSAGTNLSFEWDFGDGSPVSTDVDPTHTYATAGTFTVVLTATNSVGWDVAMGQVVIEEEPAVPSSLRGHWSLDEAGGERRDDSYYGNHLAEYNTVGWVEGQVGMAADLESDAGEYLSIEDGVQEGLDITGSLTLVGWMNAENLENLQVMAAKYEFGTNNRAYRFDVRPGGLLVLIVSPNGGASTGYWLGVNPPARLRPGEWYHVAGVFDAAAQTLSVYLDGDLIGTRSVTYDRVYDSSAPFMLGANLANGRVTQHFDGQLDDWYVFARALSESEIEGLMVVAPD
jgi:PKD repeat protein